MASYLNEAVVKLLTEAISGSVKYVVVSTFGWGEIFVGWNTGEKFHIILKGLGCFSAFRGQGLRKAKVAENRKCAHNNTDHVEIDEAMKLIRSKFELRESESICGSLLMFGVESVSIGIGGYIGELKLDDEFILGRSDGVYHTIHSGLYE